MLKNFFVQTIWPIIKPFLKDELDEFKAEFTAQATEALAEIKQELKDQLPQIARTVVVAVGESAGHFVVNEAGKVTSAIPGTVDDDIVNGILGAIQDRLGLHF